MNSINKFFMSLLLFTAIFTGANAQRIVDGDPITRGLRIPSLTTEQRNQIMVSENRYSQGQIIYNYDEGCQQYWDGIEWQSLCGKVGNAEAEISACNDIRVYGVYYMHAPLNEAHYMILPVNVTKKGSYSFMVSSGNGYYFQASGIFDETGTYEIRLSGMGTPAVNQTDHLIITNNGDVIGAACDPQVTVRSMAMGYRIDCDSLEIGGTYQTRRFMDGDNTITIPVDVIELGTTTVTTDMINGIRFSATYTFTSYGPQELVLQGNGSPVQEGTFRYTFTTDGSIKTTCSFTVDVISLLGTFEDPGCNCLAIYQERPMTVNGEYWLMDCKTGVTAPVRTYCDIAGGGWTLVWSYSEQTAYSRYNTNSMIMSGTTWGVNHDQPRNRVTVKPANDLPGDSAINYTNYRLSRSEWTGLVSGDKAQFKAHISGNPRNMNDPWALNNYAIISPRTAAEQPVMVPYAAADRWPPAAGKLWGKRWEVKTIGGGAYGGWDEVSGDRLIAGYNSDAFCTHWDWGFGGSATQFEAEPNLNVNGGNNMIYMSAMNNAFGWFGETQPNHHFGKCAGDDYNFETKVCGTLIPHSFNNGEGRYMMWFVR